MMFVYCGVYTDNCAAFPERRSLGDLSYTQPNYPDPSKHAEVTPGSLTRVSLECYEYPSSMGMGKNVLKLIPGRSFVVPSLLTDVPEQPELLSWLDNSHQQKDSERTQ